MSKLSSKKCFSEGPKINIQVWHRNNSVQKNHFNVLWLYCFLLMGQCFNLMKFSGFSMLIIDHPVSEADFIHTQGVKSIHFAGDEFSLKDLMLPSQIQRFEDLEELSFSNWLNIEWPDGLQDMPNLRSVAFEEMGYRHIPEWIFELTQLKKLYLEADVTKKLPHDIRKLRRLEELHLEGFEKLGDEFAHLTKLKVLNLSYCPVHDLPSAIKGHRQLEHLDISLTQIDELPRWVYKLPLKKLYWHGGDERFFPEEARFKVKQIRQLWAEWQSLEILDLSYQQIIDVSLHVREWSRLKYLNLSYNQMDELPEEFCAIEALQEVDLSYNHLQDLPMGIQHWQNLRKLKLDGNPLTKLPEALHALKNLQEVSIVGCKALRDTRPDNYPFQLIMS